MRFFRWVRTKNERSRYDKKTEETCNRLSCFCVMSRDSAGGKRNAHHGGRASRRLLCRMGSDLRPVSPREFGGYTLPIDGHAWPGKPFGYKKFDSQEKFRRALTLLAMSGAFVFVISSLKIPSVSGSCSHMTGTGLGAILFGPAAVSILGLIVLVFQAILLAHGGLTTLGANTFSMAIAGPFVSYGLFQLFKKLKVNRKVSVFFAAFLGDLFTYCVTAFQLALAHNSATSFSVALKENLVIFAGTQLPLAIVEGILTVVIVIGLESYAKPELKAVGYIMEGE